MVLHNLPMAPLALHGRHGQHSHAGTRALPVSLSISRICFRPPPLLSCRSAHPRATGQPLHCPREGHCPRPRPMARVEQCRREATWCALRNAERGTRVRNGGEIALHRHPPRWGQCPKSRWERRSVFCAGVPRHAPGPGPLDQKTRSEPSAVESRTERSTLAPRQPSAAYFARDVPSERPLQRRAASAFAFAVPHPRWFHKDSF